MIDRLRADVAAGAARLRVAPVVQCGLPSVPAWVMERPEDLQALLDQLVTPTSTPLPSRPTSR